MFKYLKKYDIQLDSRFNDILGKYPKIEFQRFITKDNEHLCSKEAIEFLQGLLVYDHLERLTPREAMVQPYFSVLK